jgi:Arc/MetJ family transcription regulator
MATNLALDDRLIEQARTLGRHKSKKDAVTAALRQYVRLGRAGELVDMAGKVEYFDSYDYKVARKRTLGS